MNTKNSTMKTTLVAGTLLFFAASCSSVKSHRTPQPAPAELVGQVTGHWQGVLPCASCPGIQYQLTLNADSSWQEQSVYLSEDEKPFTESGRWKMTADSVVALQKDQPGADLFYFDGKQLSMLDINGNRIVSELAAHYLLSRQTDISGKWQIISLNGKKSLRGDFDETFPYLEFNMEEKRLSGFGGCNRLMGNFEIKGDSLLLGPLMSTKMACPQIDREQKLLNSLSEKTFRLLVAGNQLELQSSGATLVLARPE